MKKNCLIILLFLSVITVFAQKKETYSFVQRGDETLYMDVYQPSPAEDKNPCVVFVFGGGFMSGTRDKAPYVEFARSLAGRGYVVANIDYRLGLRGVKKMGVGQVKVLENAINMAVEDLYAATRYLIDHAAELKIDTTQIVICGSSAGAITVLQADYELANAFPAASVLPEHFHYAGVMSFAGAIFSRSGKVKYKNASPAPTLLLHGTSDKLVTYKQIKFANIGFFGSNALAKRFKKFDYPYYVRRYENMGHEVAGYMSREMELCDWFINNYVKSGRKLQIDQWYNDPALPHNSFGSAKPSDLYNDEAK